MTSCQREIKDSQNTPIQYARNYNEKNSIGEYRNQCDYEIYNKNNFRESTQNESETKELCQNREIPQNFNIVSYGKRSVTSLSSKNAKADDDFIILKGQKKSEYINTDATRQNAKQSLINFD